MVVQQLVVLAERLEQNQQALAGGLEIIRAVPASSWNVAPATPGHDGAGAGPVVQAPSGGPPVRYPSGSVVRSTF